MKDGAVMAKDNHRTETAVRVLVVEDFKPFRRFICNMLGKMPGLQIVGEVSDGLEAVRKAELQPDVILLDVGLPTLNGIEAARQIRTLSPESRIIFVTQESSDDVVETALSIGAAGYVAKTKIASDLPAALDAVLDGRRFLSDGLSAQEFTTRATTTLH
jgi:DNA-binding NarL/FixJ family response regulator